MIHLDLGKVQPESSSSRDGGQWP